MTRMMGPRCLTRVQTVLGVTTCLSMSLVLLLLSTTVVEAGMTPYLMRSHASASYPGLGQSAEDPRSDQTSLHRDSNGNVCMIAGNRYINEPCIAHCVWRGFDGGRCSARGYCQCGGGSFGRR